MFSALPSICSTPGRTWRPYTSFQETPELSTWTEMREESSAKHAVGFCRLQVAFSRELQLQGQFEQQLTQPHVGRLLGTDICKSNQNL